MQHDTRLKTLRKSLGLSVAGMADALGLSGTGSADKVREVERGARDLTGPMLKVVTYLEADLNNKQTAAINTQAIDACAVALEVLLSNGDTSMKAKACAKLQDVINKASLHNDN